MNFKRMIYVAVMSVGLVGGGVAAADNAAIIQAIKANPSLLDFPETKKMIKPEGEGRNGVVNVKQVEPLNQIDANISADKEVIAKSTSDEVEKRRLNDLEALTRSPLTIEKNDDYLNRLLTRQIKGAETTELKRYGIEFFSNRNGLDLASLPVPENYKIVPKDVLSVILYGPKSDNMSLTVDKDGAVVIPSFGPLQIAGLTFSEAKKTISDALMAAFPNVGVSINIAQFSTIQVTLAGEVATPGLYNISSFSTVKEALIAAGGLSKNGSMREVLIKRRGKTVTTVDLYRIIRGTEKRSDVLLQAGDVVVVPVVGKSVRISGDVKRPAIYEAKKGETLGDLLSYAGGLSATANKNDIRISRYDAHEKVTILSVNVEQASKASVYDQDEVVVYGLDKNNVKGVTLYGNVIKPGFWPLPKEGMSVADFFKPEIKRNTLRGVFLEETYFDYAIIKRITPDLKEELIGFSLDKALRGEEKVTLKSRDEIFILNRSLATEKPIVKITGECVSRPGEYSYFEKMTIRALLSTAGTNCPIDEEKVTVVSRDPDTLRYKVSVIDIRTDSTMALNPFDEIRVLGFYTTNPVYSATINGEVYKPGSYPISEERFTLRELINAAGGMTDKASLDKVEIVRYEIRKGERVRSIHNITPVTALSDHSPQIEPYDEVTVFRIPRWNERQSVKLLGKVRYPGEYAIEDGDTLSKLIERAGGFMPTAYLPAAVFTREEIKKRQREGVERQVKELEQRIMYTASQPTEAGQSASDKAQLVTMMDRLKADVNQTEFAGRLALHLEKDLRRFKNSQSDITLKNGDVLYVPEREDSVIVQGEVLNPNAVVYNGGYALHDYLDKAGGLKDSADNSSIFVVHANGEAQTFKSNYLFGSDTPIGPGDTIIVPMEISTYSGMLFAKDITSILYQLAVSVAALNTIGAL